MNIVYQFTAFLSISLIAIVVAVFVVGVSLLGKAIKRSTQEKTQVEKNNKEEVQTQIAELKETLSDCTDKNKIIAFKKDIRSLEDRLRKHENQIKKIEKSPNFLTVNGGILHPGIFLLLSLVCSLIAAGISSNANIYKNFLTTTIPVIIWLFGVFLIYAAMRMIINSLKIIQDVAMTSDEAVLRDNVEALTKALRIHETSKKPILELYILRPKCPIKVGVDEEFTIEFDLTLKQGDMGKNIEVYFFSAPDEFVFPNMDTWHQDKLSKVPNYLSTRIKINEVKKGVRCYSRHLYVKAPQKRSKFKLLYQIICDGYNSGIKEIQIKVIKKRKRKK